LGSVNELARTDSNFIVRPLFSSQTRGVLGASGIYTVNDLLRADSREALGFQNDLLSKGINGFYDSLVLGPEGRLIWNVLGTKPDVLTEDLDSIRRQVVWEQIRLFKQYNGRKYAVVDGRLGLTSGNPFCFSDCPLQTVDESQEPLSPQRKSKIFDGALLWFRQKGARGELAGSAYRLSESSVARGVWGVELPMLLKTAKQLGQLTLTDLALSPATLQELTKFLWKKENSLRKPSRSNNMWQIPLSRFIFMDLGFLTPEAREEIFDRFREDLEFFKPDKII